MTPVLPDILFDEQYKDQWEWDGWKPKAKDGAPEELKAEIESFIREVEDEDKNAFIDDDIDEIEEI